VRWTGPDGRDLLLYHLPRDGYEVGAALPGEGAALRAAWAPLRRELVARTASRHVAVLVGADHHEFHPDIPALRNSLAMIEPEHEVRVSRLDEYLEEVEREQPELVTFGPAEL